MPARLGIGVVIGALLAADPASAQNDPPDYGFEWATIDHPGNRDTIESEVPYDPGLRVGGVDHKYRIAKTEVTVGQWLEFINAYWPYWEGQKGDQLLTGFWITATNHGPGDPKYKMAPGAENRPTNMGWHVAARYVNWLCNGKGTEQSDFDTGAYDASTFTENGDDSWNDQPEHTPGSPFWIPTVDEWTKAVYYDPNRYGPGQEGYWEYCDGGNEKLIEDWPWNGGETSARIPYDPNGPWLDVGAYPSVQTPWGLLDASGGVQEWLEDLGGGNTVHFAKGRKQFDGSPYLLDRVDWFRGYPPNSSGAGLRLASLVPTPASGALSVAFCGVLLRRRR